jgi:signal transduction histidine kinase
MTEAELASRHAEWERTQVRLFLYLPYGLLGVSALITYLQPLWNDPLDVPLVTGLAGFTLAWLLAFHRFRVEEPRRTWILAIYFVVLMLIVVAALTISPWYGILGFSGYFQAVDYFTGFWRWAGVVTTAVCMACSQVGGWSSVLGLGPIWFVLVAFNVGMASAFIHFALKEDQRNIDQKRALAELAEANAKLAAALEENAGLHEQLLVQAREAGVLDERQRMAREIHDTMAQGLAGIIAQLQAAEQVPGDRTAWQRHVANAAALARESLTEARRTVHAVEPAALERTRLPDAIGDVARRWSDVHRVAAVLTTTGEIRPMHPDVEVTLLRTAQEALANVAKHAEATRVGLTLSYMEDLVTLDVRDDGVGFSPDAPRTNGTTDGGFGLTGMRQRILRVAGRLAIESEPGAGTAISASVPAIPLESAS